MRQALVLAALLSAASAAAQAPAERDTAKPVLGVLKLQDETGAMPFQGGVGRVLTNILTNELAARPAFTVVERRRLMAILEEQDLAASGRLAPGDGPKIGQLTGADYLVMGTVTAFQRGVETRSGKARLFGVGGGKASSTAYLAIDLRVVDTTSGEIAFARTIEGRTTSTRTSAGISLGAVDAGYESFKSEADAKVVRAAIVQITDYLECAMVRRDGCLAQFADEEKRRVDRTRGAIEIDADPASSRTRDRRR
ncbi:CsgG/HfaB family protein [Chiayiivirga flava]|uniref:Curli production assembly/transport component CsgG n=1 Tax=Chiayiivirga flava TaxID=659595 RepID=A0A7W8D8A8_9GAMM|nr:curli biogenesis system outer membrane secretion channel CsgG [Chiayiivirga flava]